MSLCGWHAITENLEKTWVFDYDADSSQMRYKAPFILKAIASDSSQRILSIYTTVLILMSLQGTARRCHGAEQGVGGGEQKRQGEPILRPLRVSHPCRTLTLPRLASRADTFSDPCHQGVRKLSALLASSTKPQPLCSTLHSATSHANTCRGTAQRPD